MQRWQIIGEDFIEYLAVSDGVVMQADAELVDLMGMTWIDAQQQCIDRSWSGQILPSKIRHKARRVRIAC
jgi:hypothetical protein